MKFALALMMSVFAFSAVAGERVSEVVARIEADRNVRCDYVKSSFAICLGAPRELAACRYSQTFNCHGVENFTLKIKVKEFYNSRINGRDTVVRGIKIK